MLSHTKSGWFLHENLNNQTLLKMPASLLKPAFFFCLNSLKTKKRKYLVIFFDQINEEIYQIIKYYAKN